jgi:putative ABC transport system ATP-binding protein
MQLSCIQCWGPYHVHAMALSIRNLKKTFRGPDGVAVPVVNIDAFDIADAEQVALVGTSGSGKTTLLHLIAGIHSPDAGEIVFRSADGGVVNVATLDEPQRDQFRGANVGYIFQTHHLLTGFTALENVLLGMSFTGRSADRAWAEHLLAEVGLKERLNYRPGKLSVGQQQRVAVARALANRPRLVLADEPTGALDPSSAQTTLDLIRKLVDEASAALMLVTHDLGIAGQLPRQVVLSDINAAATSYRGKSVAAPIGSLS